MDIQSESQQQQEILRRYDECITLKADKCAIDRFYDYIHGNFLSIQQKIEMQEM